MCNHHRLNADDMSVKDSKDAIVQKVQVEWNEDRVESGEIPIVVVGAMLSYIQRLNSILQIGHYSAFEVSTMVRAHMSAAKRLYVRFHGRDVDFSTQTDQLFSWSLGRNLDGCNSAFRFYLVESAKKPRQPKSQFNALPTHSTLLKDRRQQC